MKVIVARFLMVSLALLTAGGEQAVNASVAPKLKEEMTAGEFERAGLGKLSAAELAALESWLDAKCTGRARPGVPVAPPPVLETVAFNTSSGKYHCVSCQWALRCTRNCVTMSSAEARLRGGRACKVCRGTCR